MGGRKLSNDNNKGKFSGTEGNLSPDGNGPPRTQHDEWKNTHSQGSYCVFENTRTKKETEMRPERQYRSCRKHWE